MTNNVVKLNIPPRDETQRKVLDLNQIDNVVLLKTKLADMGRHGMSKNFDATDRRFLADFDVQRAVAALGFDAVFAKDETFLVPRQVKASLRYDFSLVTDEAIDEGLAPDHYYYSMYRCDWVLQDLFPEVDYDAMFAAIIFPQPIDKVSHSSLSCQRPHKPAPHRHR